MGDGNLGEAEASKIVAAGAEAPKLDGDVAPSGPTQRSQPA
jgi:hypothetical protein